MAYGLDPITDFGPAPLERYRAGLGEYLAAIADEVIQSNPVPSLRRYGERIAREYGDTLSSRRELEEGFEAFGMGRREDLGFAPLAPKLPREEVARRAKELGLTLDRPMTAETLDSILAERRRRLANQLVFDRADMGTSGQTLGVLAEFLVTAADPLNIASAFIPFGRAPLIAARLAQISSPGVRRLATGAVEGALGNLAVEPFVALAALDEDPQYGAVNWLLTAAFGAGLGGGLHWLVGRVRPEIEPDKVLSDRLRQNADAILAARERGEDVAALYAERARISQEAGRRVRAYSVPADAPQRAAEPPYGPRAANEEAADRVPQETARLVDEAAPETRDAAAQVAMAQVLGADRRPDVAWIFEADRRFVAAKAAYAEQTRFRQELRVSLEEMRERQRLQESEIARLKAAAAEGSTFKFSPPADFKPSKAALAEAKAMKAGRAPGRKVKEPQSLAEFVRDKGGIATTDTLAGDLRANDLQRAGLLRLRREGGVQKDGSKKRLGRSADEIGEAAWQEGFYTERPTAEQLIADLVDDASGARKTYADLDQLQKWDARRQEEKAYDDWLDSLDATGLDIAKYDDRTLAYILTLDPARQKVLALEEALAAGRLSEAEGLVVAARLENELAAAQADAIAEARARVEEQRPEGFEADLEHRAIEAHGVVWQNTRGGGEQFHGTSRPIERLDDDAYTTLNIYGQGFYSTDAVDIARGYGNKGRGKQPTLYRTTEAGPTKLYDMEAPLTPAFREKLKGLTDNRTYGDYEEFLADATTLREFFDEVRSNSSDLGHSADTVQDFFMSVREALEAEGYRGFRHIGGVNTNKAPHRVAIYWFPEQDVRIEPVDWGAYHSGSAEGPSRSITREEFDAVDTHLRRLEERGELAPHTLAEPEIGRAGEGRSAEGAADQFEPAALAANISQAGFRTEARIDPATLEAFTRRQDDIANDLHADVAASREAEALVLDRDKADALTEAAEAEALARPLLTEADKAAIAESDARYKDEKAMLDAFAACRLGAGGA